MTNRYDVAETRSPFPLPVGEVGPKGRVRGWAVRLGRGAYAKSLLTIPSTGRFATTFSPWEKESEHVRLWISTSQRFKEKSTAAIKIRPQIDLDKLHFR